MRPVDAKAVQKGRFENGPATYWLDSVHCEGDEDSLFVCRHKGIGIHNCTKENRAGVKCGGMNKPPPFSKCYKVMEIHS